MTDSTGARGEILARIRASYPPASASVRDSYDAIARTYQRSPVLDHAATLRLFIERLLDYDAEVIELAGEAQIGQTVEEVLDRSGEDRLVVSPGLPQTLLPRRARIAVDNDLTTPELDNMQVVLTPCEVAIASTGTIILVHGELQGRRAITLLPDHHICLVRRDQVYENLPEALAVLAVNVRRPITTISGPSATSDIEMTRIRGVHGPRRLTVLLYGPSPNP